MEKAIILTIIKYAIYIPLVKKNYLCFIFVTESLFYFIPFIIIHSLLYYPPPSNYLKKIVIFSIIII